MVSRTSVVFAVEWYDAEINAGVAAYAREAGWILYDYRMYSDIGGMALDVAGGWTGDGVIALVNHADSSIARLVRGVRAPVVDLVNEAPELPLPRVVADNRAIGAMAAGYLMDIGYEHLAFQRMFRAHVVDDRMAGFRDAVLQEGNRFHAVDFLSTPRSLNPHTDMAPWLAEALRELPKPLGVMMHHDGESMMTFMACERAGLRIPEDVAVLGVDNNELRCELGPVGLSSIDRNLRRHGYEAAALLDRLMQGEPPPAQPILIPPKEVVVRQSTDALAFQDADMLRAISFLRNNYRNPAITVDDVVSASRMSRRKLYYLFKKHVGRGVREELTHLRLKEAQRLLATTETKVFAVAMKAGFANERQLARACRENSGVSPRAYRERCAGRDARQQIG